MNASFSQDGAKIELDRPEYIFLALTMSYLLDGLRISDNDFRNILGLDREAALRFRDELMAAERRARQTGEHWNPYPSGPGSGGTAAPGDIDPSGAQGTRSIQ